MILSKVITPKTKTELVRAIQQGSFRSFEIYEGQQISNMPTSAHLFREGASIIVLRG